MAIMHYHLIINIVNYYIIIIYVYIRYLVRKSNVWMRNAVIWLRLWVRIITYHVLVVNECEYWMRVFSISEFKLFDWIFCRFAFESRAMKKCCAIPNSETGKRWPNENDLIHPLSYIAKNCLFHQSLALENIVEIGRWLTTIRLTVRSSIAE